MKASDRNTKMSHRVSQAGFDALAKMTPLEGSVTWSTWGSKLESIFTPIFATLPTLQGIQVYTHVNSSLDIYLAQGLSKDGTKWRDTMVYIIMERPSHGKLNDYSTSSDYITYTPRKGWLIANAIAYNVRFLFFLYITDYCGTDFFTFRLQLGSLSSAAATVAITIDNEKPVGQKSSSSSSDALGGYAHGSALRVRSMDQKGAKSARQHGEFDPTSML